MEELMEKVINFFMSLFLVVSCLTLTVLCGKLLYLVLFGV